MIAVKWLLTFFVDYVIKRGVPAVLKIIRRKRKKSEIRQAAKEQREKQENAQTPEERDDAVENAGRDPF